MLLDDATIRAGLRELPGWEHRDGALRRSFDLGGFRAAIAFIGRIADAAEAADHHPELTNVYARVDVALTTHDAGGVTGKDLALARAIEALAAHDS